MRKFRGSIAILLLTAALAGCSAARSPAATPSATPPATPVSGSEPAPSSAAVPAPLPAGPCTPGNSAVDMTVGLQGGVASPRPKEEPSAARPWLLYLSVDQLGANPGGGVTGTIYAIRSGTATVPPGELLLRANLTPAPGQAWFDAHVTVEGITPTQQSQSDAGGFELRLPAGKAGEAFRVTLRDVLPSGGSAGDVSITFCRSAVPSATLLYQTGDGWHPAPSQLKTSGPLTLRVAFTAPMDRQSVEDALRQTKVEWHNDGPLPRTARAIGSLTWVDDRTVAVTFPEPPGVLALSPSGARDAGGLFVTNALPYIYTGEPAYLEAVNPATGKGRRLLDLPSEVQGARVSPDGRWLYLDVARMQAGNEYQPRWQQLLYEVATGKSREVTPAGWNQVWLPNGEQVSVTLDAQQHAVVTRTDAAGNGQQTVLATLPGFERFLLSPDANRAALLVRVEGDPAPDDMQAYHLVIASTDGKSQTTLPEVVRFWRPGKDGLRLYDPVWSPDGTRLAFTQNSAAGVAVAVADLAAGHVRTLAPSVSQLRGRSLDPVSWSPDSRRLQVGPALLSAETGQEQRRLTDPVGPGRWSPDSQWLVEQTDDWGAVRATNAAGGQSVALGEGLPVGFTAAGEALIIRWAGSKDRMIFGI